MNASTILDDVKNSPAAAALLAIVIAALCLRLWGIWFGLPFLLHNDEGFEVIRALQLGSGEFDFDRIGKGGYFYLLFFEYGALFVILMLSGVVGSPAEFAQYFVSDPSVFYLTGRATTAILGAATVITVYLIGKRAYAPRAGLIAAALLGGNVLHASLSHYITVDVPMVFLATIALFFAIRIAAEGAQRDYWLAAAVAAFATATKVPAIVLLLPLTIAHIYYVSLSQFSIRAIFLTRSLWQAAVIFVALYVALAPGLLINFDVFSAEMIGKFAGGADESPGIAVATNGAMTGRNLIAFYIDKLRESMGTPVFVVAIAGILFALVRCKKADVILLSYAIVTFVAIAVTSDEHHFFPRYALPILPPALLLAGRILDSVFSRLSDTKQGLVAAAVVSLLLVAPVLEIAQQNYRLTQPDTRVLARAWIDSNLPQGSRIFIEGARTQPYNATVPLQNSAENLRKSIARYETEEPGKALYYKLELKALSGSSYDLLLVSFDNLRDLEHYKDLGVEYFVLRPGVRAAIRPQAGWPEFIADVKKDPKIGLIKRFEPDERNTPGPVIEIYQLR